MTTRPQTLLLLGAALAAAACQRNEPQAPANQSNAVQGSAPANVAAPAPATAPKIVAERGGLRVDDQELRFGTAQEAVVERLSALGRPPIETNAECGAGPTQIGQWPNGLSLLFQEGRFLGWQSDGPGATVRTERGIGVGSTRAEVTRAYAGATIDESTLGTEFAADGLGGLLDGEEAGARVTTLWAGLTCHFR